MKSFQLGAMTFRSLFKKPETRLYPAQNPPAPPQMRGRVAIDESRCILCGLCGKACPAAAIAVERKQRTWALRPFSCVQCGSCVRACPKQCLSMAPERTAIAAQKSIDVYEVPEVQKSA